jgi:hypothetical protein
MCIFTKNFSSYKSPNRSAKFHSDDAIVTADLDAYKSNQSTNSNAYQPICATQCCTIWPTHRSANVMSHNANLSAHSESKFPTNFEANKAAIKSA